MSVSAGTMEPETLVTAPADEAMQAERTWRLGPVEVVLAPKAAPARPKPQSRGERSLASRIGELAGSLIMWAGAALLLFAVWTWVGTAALESGVQDDLMRGFQAEMEQQEAQPAAPVLVEDPLEAQPASYVQAATPAPVNFNPKPVKPKGPGVAIIAIPKIGVEKVVVEGTGTEDLKKGPGHYPGTPMPGQPGNVGIAGHRTTYGGPFRLLDKLKPGDRIELTTLNGLYVYAVTGSRIVDPSRSDVLNPTDEATLTLTTCHPLFSAAERLIVFAKLVEQPPIAVPVVSTPPQGAPAEPAPLPDMEPLPKLTAEQVLPELPTIARPEALQPAPPPEPAPAPQPAESPANPAPSPSTSPPPFFETGP